MLRETFYTTLLADWQYFISPLRRPNEICKQKYRPPRSDSTESSGKTPGPLDFNLQKASPAPFKGKIHRPFANLLSLYGCMKKREGRAIGAASRSDIDNRAPFYLPVHLFFSAIVIWYLAACPSFPSAWVCWSCSNSISFSQYMRAIVTICAESASPHWCEWVQSLCEPTSKWKLFSAGS